MRLLTKTTLYFLIAMILLLTMGGFYLFNQFSKELDHQTDQELILDEIQWIRYLRSQADEGITFILRTPELSIAPVDRPTSEYPTLTRTKGFGAKQNREVPFRQLSHVVAIYDIPYQIVIRKSQEQRSVFIANVTRIMLLVFVALLLIMLLVNWLINKNIWKPFKHSLVKIRGAELQKMEAIHFDNTPIKEFNELNAALNFMTGKIYRDYVIMKEFTENAAHEMQTPLAVVQSKIELLLQGPDITDEQYNSITQASGALKRLSNLNQSLLLLAKIENNQYDTSEAVALVAVARKYLQLFDEIIKDKQLVVETFFSGDLFVQMHPFLADTLMSNLIGNAVKYNYPGGRLLLFADTTSFKISNTSNSPAIDSNLLFKRFQSKKYNNDTSNGLGLAIVKKIGDTHKLKVDYEYKDGLHSFLIVKK